MSNTKSSISALTLAALGVVYGDIGTSPLYAVKETFAHGRVALTDGNIYGVLSLIFWTISVIVSLKYVTLILRADNNGEGGLIAMLALATNTVKNNTKLYGILLAIGMFGTALFYGDGVITPAVSVLSAVEGLTVVSPSFHPYVLPLALVVLFGLFYIQRFGTADIGKFFGPVMAVWFAVLAILGLVHVLDNPEVLRALNPSYAIKFGLEQPFIVFLALGAVVLCVTGGEALYADMGHFGKKPIRIAWFTMVLPALVLNYFGQGALLLADHSAVENPFFHMAPDWATLPLVALSTLATVIASQALISGAFSVTKQAIQMGFLPRLNIVHTSTRDTGQIYIPTVNWGLFVVIVVAVLMFKTSSNLAAAYGIAVTTDMLITTVLTYFVVRKAWGYPVVLVATTTTIFLAVDSLFFASNLLKLPEGGWFPLLLAGTLFMVMRTWRRGRALVTEAHVANSEPIQGFLDGLLGDRNCPILRVEGTAVYLSREHGIVPASLLHNLKHNKIIHDVNVFVTVVNHEVPWISMSKRISVEPLGHDCWQVEVHFGFKNDQDVPAALSTLNIQGLIVDPMQTSYFLSRDIIVPLRCKNSGMAFWREKLFASMHKNATSAADYLGLPANRVVELGSQIEI